MKVLCCGDRNWHDRRTVMKELLNLPPDTIVIEGEARGADTISRLAAEYLLLEIERFPADWDRYGKSAGPIRNRQMLDEKPDLVLAFHSNIENSKGTKDCITEASKRGIEVKIIK
jgi:hypothetical protein